MWSHVWLLSLVAILTGGVVLLSRLLEVRRLFNPPWARSLLSCVLFYGADFLLYFIVHYEALNISRLAPGQLHEPARWLLSFLPFIFSILYFYYLLRTIDHFTNPPHPLLVRLIPLLFGLLFLLDTAAHTYPVFPNQVRSTTFFLADAALALMNPVTIIFLVILLAQREMTLPHSSIGRSLAWILLGRQLLNQIISVWNHLSARLWNNPGAAANARIIHTLYVGLSFALVFFWLTRYAIPFLQKGLVSQLNEDRLSAFFNQKDLSAREGAVVRGIARGQSNKEVAMSLGLSPSTIKNHLYRIYQKLEINSRFELLEMIQHSETPILMDSKAKSTD